MMRRALVVDDDPTMVRTLSDVLELHGWHATPAYSGRSALEAAKRESFDVVLMDIRMPGLDGVSAFKAIRAVRPELRVVLMTAYTAEDVVADALRAGVHRVMPKPVDVPALVGGVLG
jgi:two-component system, NtrC family, response regulator HydG